MSAIFTSNSARMSPFSTGGRHARKRPVARRFCEAARGANEHEWAGDAFSGRQTLACAFLWIIEGRNYRHTPVFQHSALRLGRTVSKIARIATIHTSVVLDACEWRS